MNSNKYYELQLLVLFWFYGYTKSTIKPCSFRILLCTTILCVYHASLFHIGGEPFVLTPKWLKDQMLNPAMTVKIAPMLLINGGLPNSSKTTALRKLLKKAKSEEEGGIALKKAKLPSPVLEEEDGITFCDMLAARNLIKNKIVYVPPVHDKGYPAVMYAGVENTIRTRGQQLNEVAVFPKNLSGFENEDLNKHLRHVLNDLYEANYAKQCQFTEWDESHTCGLALINVWDIGLNKIPTYVLSHLAGHLYNSHVWMFLDLLRDADHLYEVPDIPDNRYDKSRNDKELIMRWHSRIRYFLRFAELASKKNGSRQNVCNIVTSYTGSEEIEGHMMKLEEAVDTVSKQLELQELIDTETIAFHHLNTEPLYQLFEEIIRAGLDNTEDVPISFIFLRSMFYDKDQLYIQKDEELRKISKELCIDDDKNFEWFCHLFTSFGSIIDVSLIDPTSNLIILKPIQFLNKFDKLFYYSPSGTIVTSHGLVSKTTSEAIFGNDAHFFMSFLKSLHIATEISPKQVNISTEQCSYYVPNICTSPPLLQCSPTSLHLVHDMNVSLSHFQVLFTRKFLNCYPEAQLNVSTTPHINITRFCSPSVSLIFELVYIGDIIEFRFPLDLHEEVLHKVCEYIVCICHDIMDQNDILYDFAIMCSNNVSQQVCKLQTRHHSLPLGEEDCKECSCPHDSASVKIFNDVLKKVRPVN